MFLLKSDFKAYEAECGKRFKDDLFVSRRSLSHDLARKLGELVRSERKITNEILKLISQALEQRSYLDLGYPSMFEWLTKGFGYSNASAYRRIEAAKLLKSLPEDSKSEVSLRVEKGEMNLTTLSKVQSSIKAQEKVSGKRVSVELKEEVLRKISGNQSQLHQSAHSEEETQKILFKLLPDAQKEILQDRRKVISEDFTRHSITFTREMEEDLNQVKELLSHSCPSGTDQEVIAYALKFLLQRKKPAHDQKKRSLMKHKTLTQIASAAEAICVMEGCSYEDPQTGKTCGSRFQLQIDHIIPKAKGGSDEPRNLRVLCRPHNLLAAERIFSKKHMDRFRRQN